MSSNKGLLVCAFGEAPVALPPKWSAEAVLKNANCQDVLATCAKATGVKGVVQLDLPARPKKVDQLTEGHLQGNDIWTPLAQKLNLWCRRRLGDAGKRALLHQTTGPNTDHESGVTHR